MYQLPEKKKVIMLENKYYLCYDPDDDRQWEWNYISIL